ncbi:MAG: endonuclease Q family protein [Candidatus Micrarchaeota archaeon]
MQPFDCDLHLHGKFAGGVSKECTIPVLAEQSRKKGLQLLVTADISHRDWLSHVKSELVEESNGIFSDKEKKCQFIVGTEVEDNLRIHHLVYLPDLTRAAEFREKVKPFGTLDCSMCGRPKLRLTAEQIAQIVHDIGGIIGPGHAFTPYSGIFAHHDSWKAAYGSQAEKILFLELGLSADTAWADQMKQNHELAFLSSSDAHSPWPHRLGREWNRILLKQPSFSELKNALSERTEPAIIMNAGLDPCEGKYHATGCNGCFKQFEIGFAEKLKWKCPFCKGEIKRGVKDRIIQLTDTPVGKHPVHRGKYFHSLPLAEILQQVYQVENPLSKKVQSAWEDLVERFGNEIRVLTDVSESELTEFNPQIAKYVLAFRNGWVHYEPGGGGQYGKPTVCLSQEEFEREKNQLKKSSTTQNKFRGQKTIGEYR